MMRRKIMMMLICSLLLFLSSAAAPKIAQNQEAKHLETSEINSLIELLKLPNETVITWKKDALKRQSSYALFLGSRMDFSFESEVKSWLQKWNEKDGRNYGELKIVKDIKEADIVLARYQNAWETTEESASSDATLDNAALGGYSKLTYKVRPLYSYILLPKKSEFELLWRQRKKIRLGEKSSTISASDILVALSKRLKSKS